MGGAREPRGGWVPGRVRVESSPVPGPSGTDYGLSVPVLVHRVPSLGLASRPGRERRRVNQIKRPGISSVTAVIRKALLRSTTQDSCRDRLTLHTRSGVVQELGSDDRVSDHDPRRVWDVDLPYPEERSSSRLPHRNLRLGPKWGRPSDTDERTGGTCGHRERHPLSTNLLYGRLQVGSDCRHRHRSS